MAGWMSSMSADGSLAFWIIDERFLELYSAEPLLADTIASVTHRLAQLDISYPSLVIETSSGRTGAARLVARLRELGFPGAIGVHWNRNTGPKCPIQSPDFVICDEELIPEHYRGQAAAAWVHSRAGQLPVVLSPARIDFLRDVVWLACGGAGIWYRPLPPVTSPENSSQAIQLRASTAFFNRFEGGVITMATRWDADRFMFSLQDFQKNWAAVIPAGSAATVIPAPAGFAGHPVAQNWYNPATDQTIIRPLTRLPASVSVQPPDANLWVYSISAAMPGAEDRTTVTAIREWAD
jgi:hypothetical protein